MQNPPEIILKQDYLCMKKGQVLKACAYETYRCTKKPNCQRTWTFDELMDKIKKPKKQ